MPFSGEGTHSEAANYLRALLFTAPEEIRTELCELSTNRLVSIAARFRPGREPRDLVGVTKLAMRSIARRHRDLSEENSALDERLKQLVAEAAPALVTLRVWAQTRRSLC
jgi:transposase